jgi:LemA protein
MRTTGTPRSHLGRYLAIGAAVIAVIAILGTCSTYNSMVGRAESVDAQWAQVENVYQRRADLVPNLVATVKGAAAHERETLQAVTDARARVGQVALPGGAPTDTSKLAEFQQAQDQLGGALSRLLVVAEAYPQLTATQAFRDLQAQLEGTENRITVERMRYNEAARDFNTARNRFPAALVVGFFGDRFTARPYFTAQAGAATAPKVEL